MCRQQIILPDHMNTIRFCQAWDSHHGRDGELGTFVFALAENEIGPDGQTEVCYSHP